MEQIITDFFQSIYEQTREEMPEFLVKAHEFDVSRAIRNPDAEGSAEILAKEDMYALKMDTLRITYGKVLGVLAVLPESLKVAGLHVLSVQVADTIGAMQLSDRVANMVNEELTSVLGALPTPTIEQMQQAGAIIAQIVAAQENTG